MSGLTAHEADEMQLVGKNEIVGYDRRYSIFQPPRVNIGTQSEFVVNFYPLAPLKEGQMLEFHLPKTQFYYTDLARSTIQLRLQITRNDGTVVDQNDKVALSNLPLASLFRQADVFLGQQVVSPDVNVLYSYKAMIDTLVRKSARFLEAVGPMWGYYKDTAGHMDSVSVDDGVGDEGEEGAAAGANLGLVQRWQWTNGGVELKLEGPVFSDLWDMNQFLPSSVDIRLKLYPQEPRFALMYSSLTQNYRVRITDAVFRAQMIEPSTQLAIEHLRLMSKTNALFPVPRSVMKSFSIPKGFKDWQIDTLFSDSIPYEIYIGFVDSEAFNGKTSLNPFHFQTFDLATLAFHVEKETPILYEPDFDRRHFTTEYTNLVHDNSTGAIIQYPDFDRGYCIYRLNISPGLRQAHNLSMRRSQTRLRLRFKQDTPKNITCIVYGRYHSSFEIDKAKNVFAP